MKLFQPDGTCRYLTDITPETVAAMHCRSIAIDRTKVTLWVNKWIAQRPSLSHTNKCHID